MKILKIIPTRDKRELFMAAAYEVASFSKDPSTKVGAVITINDSIISTGFNGFPRKVADLEDRYLNKEIKYSLVCHAEANAIWSAGRLGRSCQGATLHTPGIPCAECMKGIIQSGISDIVVHKQWPDLHHSEKWIESMKTSDLMRREANINLHVLDMFLDKKGFLNKKEIKV